LYSARFPPELLRFRPAPGPKLGGNRAYSRARLPTSGPWVPSGGPDKPYPGIPLAGSVELVAEEALVLAEHWRPDLVVGRTVAWLVAALRPHW
jgi:hypothetical protein